MSPATPFQPAEDNGVRRRETPEDRRIAAESLRAQRERERAGVEALALRVSALRERLRAGRR
jgi:hypothetical protein